jgi:membrane associated rhomboid family serine protease
MIPIRDVIPSRTTPYVTFSLIIANALAFLCQFALDPAVASRFLETFAFIPAHLTIATSPALLTAVFLHAGWAHLIGNLLFLWIFGDNVEDRFGHGRFLAFYLVVGVAANVAQYAAAPQSLVPIIGASGAIAGVMGAYFVLFPKSRVVMLIWLLFYVDFVEIPAVLFLGFWFIFQFLGGVGQTAAIAVGGSGGVAFFAHISGFVIGAISGRLLARPERSTVAWWDQTTP